MVVGVHKRAVGVFAHRRDAEHALHELKKSGFAMDRVSVVAQNADGKDDIAGAEVRERVGDKSDEGATVGAVSGGTLGGLTGLLVGLGTLAIPGIGPIMLAGATATALATTLAGAGIGALAGSLLGGLIGLGIPEERAKVYNDRVQRGQYLVIIDGTDAEIAEAEAILRRGGVEEFGIYDNPNSKNITSGVPDRGIGVATAATPVVNTTAPLQRRNKRAIGVFAHRRDAEAAITDLRDGGISLEHVSIIGKNADHNISDRVGGVDAQDRVSNTKADDGAKAGAATGAALGGLGGLLVGLGTLAIPGVGPVLLGGTVATALATALTGGAIGAAAGGIAGGLVGLGIPEKNAKVYSDRVNKGDYLVIVDGTDAEVHRAEEILRRRHVEDFAIYDARDLDRLGDRDRQVAATPVVNTTAPLHRNKRAIGVFAHRRDAEAAITDLRDGGISLEHVSIIGKNADHNISDRVGGVDAQDRVSNTKADDGAKAGAATGAALGGLGGLLVGLGTLAIPGVGPVLLGGTVATALATALTGGAIGAAAGGIAGGLVGLGIPEKNAKVYSDRVNKGDYLVIVDGTDAEVHRAEEILRRRHVEDFAIYDATDNDRLGDRDRQVAQTPVVNTTPTNYAPNIDSDDPAVIIIDRRDERTL